MKRVWVVLLALISVGCGGRLGEGEATQTLKPQQLANKIVRDLLYFKDPATGLCYAYYWGGTEHGGSALVLVPECMIPSQKLIVAQAKLTRR